MAEMSQSFRCICGRLGLGYLPQEPSIFRKLTAEQNILAVLETMSIPREERFSRVEQLLEEFGVDHVRKTRGDALSGGERRRVEIARCLATEPEYILLDEPFAGIDPLAIDDIREIIVYLRQQGIGILITDHNVRETLGITDRAYIMTEAASSAPAHPPTLSKTPKSAATTSANASHCNACLHFIHKERRLNGSSRLFCVRNLLLNSLSNNRRKRWRLTDESDLGSPACGRVYRNGIFACSGCRFGHHGRASGGG